MVAVRELLDPITRIALRYRAVVPVGFSLAELRIVGVLFYNLVRDQRSSGPLRVFLVFGSDDERFVHCPHVEIAEI